MSPPVLPASPWRKAFMRSRRGRWGCRSGSASCWWPACCGSRRRGMTEPAPFAYEGLDRVIHERARLGVLTSLVANPKGLVFADLKRLCGLTDGNLARHLQVLQESGVGEVTKGLSRNRPQTLCRITPEGRRRFLDYLAV